MRRHTATSIILPFLLYCCLTIHAFVPLPHHLPLQQSRRSSPAATPSGARPSSLPSSSSSFSFRLYQGRNNLDDEHLDATMHKKQQQKREERQQQQQQYSSSSAKAATATKTAAGAAPAGEGKNEQQQGQGRAHTQMQHQQHTQHDMGPAQYERPKAQKPRRDTTLVSSSSSSSSSSPAAEREKEKENLDVLLDTMALLVKRAVEPFVEPAPIQNYALLIGDISILITFRTVEDMLMTPMPSLDITASPDLIRNGLIAYADPFSAATHVSSVMSDGMSLGCFWLAAVLMGRAQAVEHDVNTNFTLSTWATVRTWLTLVNIRLGVLFLHALTIGEGVDLTHVQYEMSALFVTMLAWRWLNCAVTRYFTGL